MTIWDDAMGRALVQAALAVEHADVPVGAVVLDPSGQVIGTGRNQRERLGDPSAHAEIMAIRAACAVFGDGWRLPGCTLVVTLEPCAMCAGAIVQSRLARLVFGAFDAKAGAVSSLWDLVRDPRLNHRVEVTTGVRAAECEQMLRDFFVKQR
mgnify:CR=1 FL=1